MSANVEFFAVPAEAHFGPDADLAAVLAEAAYEPPNRPLKAEKFNAFTHAEILTKARTALTLEQRKEALCAALRFQAVAGAAEAKDADALNGVIVRLKAVIREMETGSTR